jgi:cyclopropane fatty-acyl-phospholipid synthase-like methyltransferase
MIKKIPYLFKKIKNKIRTKLSLSGNGERVDINNNSINFESLDVYQKNHLKRYGYAQHVLSSNDTVGDFACGTGYGTVILSKKSNKVIGIDIDKKVIHAIKKRYLHNKNVEFIALNILDIPYENHFNKIISFETIEHLEEHNIPSVFSVFYKALKNGGKLIFSVPYMQEKSEDAIKLGFHKTFYIDETKILSWLKIAGFKNTNFKYQNYDTHEISSELDKKDFIICETNK